MIQEQRDWTTDLGLLALAAIWGVNFSVVKLVLDLSGTGTLSISVDGGPDASGVFENMKAPFDDPKKDVAFVPAASLGAGARIELVGFK